MDIRSLGFRTDLRLLELAGSVIEDRGTHLVVRSPANPTHYWGNFLLLADLPVPGGEREVIGAFRTEFPVARHVAIGVDGTEDLTERVAAFAEAGLEVDSAVVLTARTVVAPAPTPAQLRPLAGDAEWEARALLNRDANPEDHPEDILVFARARAAQERALVAAGHGQRYGAFLDGRLVATAGVFRVGGDLARFQSVETHPAVRRQGLAAAVVHAAARHALDELGAGTLVIVAEPDSQALRIYRSLGFAERERMLQMQLSP